jgi:putative transposase
MRGSPEHVEKAPAAVYHELLDDGTYLNSISTMYRVLRAHDESRSAVARRCTRRG